MKKIGKISSVLAAVSSLGLLLAGCGATQGTAAAGNVLTIYTSSTRMDLDPAKSQGLPITSNGYIFRRLTAWKTSKDGTTTVVPDLATTTGTPSDGGKTWTYTLKENLHFDNGQPITSKDVKYGIERSFADSLTGGLSYHKALLTGADQYHGPFSGQELDSIQTPDDKTIVFHLDVPFGDWPWIASLAAFTPVPNGNGPAQGYGMKPVSSGPYKVESNVAGKEAVFVRNDQWKQDTDEVRVQGPEKIIWKMSQDPSVAAQTILNGSADGSTSFLADEVPPAQIAQASANPAMKKLLVTSGDGALIYLAINTQRVRDVRVRQAINYAVDKIAYQSASGGPIAGGIASTLITKGIDGYEPYDLYPTSSNRGDVEKAKQLIAQTGSPAPTLKLIATSAQAEKASSVQSSLQRAGFTVEIQTLDRDVYRDAISNNKGDYDLTFSSWQPDFPSPFANIQPLFDSSQIGNGNSNYGRYANLEVDAMIRKASETVDKEAATAIWREVDKRIMQDAPIVPLLYSHNTFVHGSNVEDFTIGQFPAYPNYLAVKIRHS